MSNNGPMSRVPRESRRHVLAALHAAGKLRPVTGRKELNELLSKLIAKFVSYEGTGCDCAKVDDSYTGGFLGGITGFELEIELLEGKFEFGQERNLADKKSLLMGLGEAKVPRTLREFTSSFHERQSMA